MEIDKGVDLCFPQLLNASCKKPVFLQSRLMVFSIILSCFSLLTVVLNLTIIISVSHFRQLHTPTNIFILSLAVSDFLMGLLLMPGEIIRSSGCWFLGNLMCSMYNYVSYIITSASVGDMVLISVDRYVAICDPLHYPTKVTERRVQLCVCLCWLCSALYGGLILMEDFKMPGRHNSCYGECLVIFGHIEGAVDIVLSFIVPVSVIVILYMRVMVVAMSQARAIHAHASAVKCQLSVTQAKKSELRAARTLGVLVAVFLLCFCPYYSVALAGLDMFNSSSGIFVLCLFCFNSCINPIIYALFYSWFRKSVKLILTLQILQPGSCEANII